MANAGTKQWLGNQEAFTGDYHVIQPTFALAGNTIGREPLNGGNGNGYDDGGASYTLTKTDVHAVAFKMRGGCEGGGKGYLGSEEAAFTLSTSQDQQIAFYENHPQDSRITELVGACSTVTKNWGTGGGNVPYAQMQMRVRRLTPTECARLQGFPDNYLSQVKGASDSSMYKALGNSMAVNVMQLLGERIQMVENIHKQLSEAA
jgi:DNA (cytosine-5)-methyltransferase 1